MRLLLALLALLIAACSREPARPVKDAGSATPEARPAYVPPPAAVTASAEVDGGDRYTGGTDPGGQGWPPAMANGPDADCTGVLTAQFSGKGGRLRRGMAALGTRLTPKDDFFPVLYFDNEASALRCRGGDGSMVVAVWNGNGWRL